MKNYILVYTDGASINNGSKNSQCGWAVKLMHYVGKTIKGQRIHSGGMKGYTNNQTEMYAVLQALKYITDKSIPVVLRSDSQYVVKTLNHEFQIGSNFEMWELLFHEAKKYKDIVFEWVKGHADDPHNIEVDRIAFEEAKHVCI